MKKYIFLSMALAFSFAMNAQGTLVIPNLIPQTTTTTSKTTTKHQVSKKGPGQKRTLKTGGLTQGQGGQSGTSAASILSFTSAEYQASTSGGGGSRSSGPIGQHYVISRPLDGFAPSIMNAASTGKVFPAMVINMPIQGGTNIISLTNAVLANYSTASSGGQSSESFSVFFQSQNMTSN